LNLLLIF